MEKNSDGKKIVTIPGMGNVKKKTSNVNKVNKMRLAKQKQNKNKK